MRIESLDAEGRGVARLPGGKVAFVEGGLPAERVVASVVSSRKNHEIWKATAVLESSSGRVAPRCPHIGVCGGCATQHPDQRTQMAAKQRGLEDNLARIGKVAPESMLPVIYGEPWGYRRRARFSVRRVDKKGGVLVGFRERRSTWVAEMGECHVLPSSISALILPLRELIEKLSVRARVPQVEVAAADNATALVFRHLLPLRDEDLAWLKIFAEKHGVGVWLQPGGPESAHPFHPADAALWYELPEFGVRVAFRPTDFTQVNFGVNRLLVSRAVRLLDPQPGERIADLFCGLGNFSLPLARRGAQVIGFEGSGDLVARARSNASANGLVAQFEKLDLFKSGLTAFGRFDKILLDPPREGAVEILKTLAADGPRRIVYVSCDPATLARDAGMLVNASGYRLTAAGVVNMFPHTAHVESIALFDK